MINRSTHVIKQEKVYRYITPMVCESLNMFPKDWTNSNGMLPSRFVKFLMGNALVCGIIKKNFKKISENNRCGA